MLLYLHIPYCDSKCHYCSFNSYVDRFDTRPSYMSALLRQLDFELEKFSVKTGEIETVFIGGGTPSTVDPTLYKPLFVRLQPYLKKGAEITVEANPNSAKKSWLQGMHKLGVNRLSLGVQSFNQTKLKALNRAHSAADAIRAIEEAYHIGFEHISLDLIYNFQEDTQELLRDDIKQAFQLPIDHISAYELTIESQTKFAHTPEVRQENEFLAFWVAEEIVKRGFEHYEISNFGNYQSLHNKGYWELKDYIGLGAGAVGFQKFRRYYPVTDIGHYIENPLNITEELITADELLTERIFLGLRSTIGIDRGYLTKAMQQRCEFLVQENKLIKEDQFYKNSNFFLADEIALFILT